MTDLEAQVRLAKKHSAVLATLSNNQKNAILRRIAKFLVAHKQAIFEANCTDIALAKKSDLALPLQKRLKFDEMKLHEVLSGINSLIELADPVGKVLTRTELDQDLILTKKSCPIGVLGVIFESRPDALVQIATLGLKSGNAVILKGGAEAQATNLILTNLIKQAALEEGLTSDWIILLEDRDQVKEILKFDRYIDLIIPRGSNAFVQYIMGNSLIPVLGHADGVCHLYVHQQADPEMAIALAVDSKTQYVAVCNAIETILVDEAIMFSFVPSLIQALQEKNVKIYGCNQTHQAFGLELVEDFHQEYLDYQLSIKIVRDVEDAISHINRYGSKHTDCIVTSDKDVANTFLEKVDAGSVMWNCSTRFADGFRYGFGAEVGISTGKIHARGPVGLEGLVTYKYQLVGTGQTVLPYTNGSKSFIHKILEE